MFSYFIGAWLAKVDMDREYTDYDIYFDGTVTGLKTGNPVRYRGIPVGIVTQMEINPDNVEQVRVTVEVNSDTPIKEDASASLEFQGLTGVAFVQLTGGTNDAPPLRSKPGEKYPVIPSTALKDDTTFRPRSVTCLMISEWPPEAWAVAEKRKAALIKADSPEIDFSMTPTFCSDMDR